MNNAQTPDMEYVLLVQGFAPELTPGVAFRRSKHFDKRNKRSIYCPYCGKPFKTVDSTVKLELCAVPRHKAKYHSTIPCEACRNEVKIVYVSA